jgi:hypothetical protein
MGKKPASSKSSSSRGNKATKDQKSSSSNNIGDTTGDEAITPGNGWIFEKDEAVKAVKCERSNQNIFRLARAYHKLRQWKKLENITSLTALSSVDDDDDDNNNSNSNTNSRSSKFYRKQLSVWNKVARDHLSQYTKLTDRMETTDRLTFVNSSHFQHDAHKNFNVLHYAAEEGDILLLEWAVALGAAIDYRTGKLSEWDSSNTRASHCDTTALLLACSNLAFFGISSQDQKRQMLQVQPNLSRTLRGHLECAVQLVKLGADCNGTYKEKNVYIQSLNLGNKNAYQLAKISKQSELISTMENFKSDEDKIRLVHCRCGSRLPWKECHGAAACGLIPYYYYENNNDSENTSSLRWRYSPLANCPCGYNNVDKYKQHFKCCWSENTQHSYRNDYNGRYLGLVSSKSLVEAESIDYSEFRKMSMLSILDSADPDRISGMYDWDVDIYVDIIEMRINVNTLYWCDLHWDMTKNQLMHETKEWNDALRRYCDCKNLTGIEREKMINMYTASPLARCANPTCTEVEVHVKFGKCTRCNSVAYCSRGCQKEHWRLSHRKNCGLNNSLARIHFLGS